MIPPRFPQVVTKYSPFCMIFDILKAPAFQKYSTLWVFSALYLAVHGFTWLCPAIPGCTLVCHDLPFHRMPHSATDWPKCFCIYRLKCSKALSGWLDGRLGGWKSPGDPILRAPAVLIIILDGKNTHMASTHRNNQNWWAWVKINHYSPGP